MDCIKNKLGVVVQKIRCFWWKYVIYTLTTGVIALFSCSFIYDKEISINIMNSWVGIILGLIALVIGIISMFLSFYNLDQSIETQKETLDKIEAIKKEIIDYIEKTSKETQEVVAKSKNETDYNQIKYDGDREKGEWKNVKKI